MRYRIYPAIGLARLGDSDEFFIGPEVVGSHGRELDTGAEVRRFKDGQFRVRKQAARFHLFQQADDHSPPVPAVLPPGAVVEWTVRLANKKDAIVRPADPPGPILPGQSLRPKADPDRADRIISAAASLRSDAGAAAKQPLAGTHAGQPVALGELRVDDRGRLLLLGGALVSAAHPETSRLTGSYYRNPDWHDDVSDGPVGARVVFADGSSVAADGAWAVVAPPDFAPGADPVVTLFDQVLQMALDQAALDGRWASPWTTLAPAPSFTRDIFPILRRARSLGWVQVDVTQLPGVLTNQKTWERINQDFARLADPGPQARDLRSEAQRRIARVTGFLSEFAIPVWQTRYLSAWADGNFTADWNGPPAAAADPTAESLTRAALEGAVGQPLSPGIEAGRITTDPTIYRLPFDFRIADGVLGPGDLTALMAQPWQADFMKCVASWWPSQRPDLARQPDGTFAAWQRPVKDGDPEALVRQVRRLGMITVQVDGNAVQVSAAEEGRDPTL